MAASLLLRQAAKRCLFSPTVAYRRAFNPIIAQISTSKKNKDVTATIEPTGVSEPWQKEVEKEVAETTKNWVSYGYDLVDRNEDEWLHMVVMFLGITLCICGGSFIIAYMPDHRMKDWHAREAFLELARREREGLPLVDPNYLPEEVILEQIPSDEELGDTPIVI